jgi:hypothetical protein
VEDHRVVLTAEEYDRLEALHPQGDGSGLIGKRAEAIVRIHMQRQNPGCIFQSPDTGADLKVVLCDGSQPLLIEVKGTASAGIAWAQLKVSSHHSHRLLVEEGIPVYRVSEVFSQVPRIYVLRHGADFTLEEEARWAFKPSAAGGQQEMPPPKPAANSGPVVIEGHSSKYDALRLFLLSRQADEVMLGFKDAAKVLGFSLPASALKYQAFWANQSDTTNRPWARAWQQAGYEVESCRLSEVDGWVRFRRSGTGA